MSHASPPVRGPSPLRGALVTIGGFVLLGLLAAWLWSLLADPAVYTVTRDGTTMGEEEASTQFGVTVTYAWLGCLAALLWGAFCAWRFASAGWSHVLITVAGAAVAAVLAWRLGLVLGPPDPEPVARSAEVGATIPMQLQIDSYGALLLLPVAALAGLLVAVTCFTPADSAETDPEGQ